MSLEDLRYRIDTIDEQLVSLLNQRAEVSLEVGKEKADNKSARYFAPERERDLVERLMQLRGAGAMPQASLLAVYREIISASIALQKPMTVAYWGPPGTFTEMAAVSRFGPSTGYYDCATIPNVFGVVNAERAEAHVGVCLQQIRHQVRCVLNGTDDGAVNLDGRLVVAERPDHDTDLGGSHRQPEGWVVIVGDNEGFSKQFFQHRSDPLIALLLDRC